MKTITFRPLILIGFIIWFILFVSGVIAILSGELWYIMGWIIGNMHMVVFLLMVKCGEQ